MSAMGKRHERRREALSHLPEVSNVASAGECTGLVPALPQNEAERLNYESLYSIEIPKIKAPDGK